MPQGETDWDINSPALVDPRRDGAEEIRALRKQVALRVNKEHVTLATSSAGGEHKEGSAKAYYEASDPTQRPDASTALSSDDAGRLWINSDNGAVSYYSGTAWVPFAGVVLEGSAIAYYAALAPTTRPDGITALGAADAGRLWIDSDNNLLSVWDGTEWDALSGQPNQTTELVAGDISGGWENPGNSIALIYINISATASGTLTIVIDYGAGDQNLISGVSSFAGSFLVPIGATLTATAVGIGSSVIGTGVAQHS